MEIVLNSNDVLIIAEAGVNHNGNIHTALKLVDVAVDAGVDVIKFQTFKTESLVTKFAPKAEYQDINDTRSKTQYEMLKSLELSLDEFKMLFDYCKQKMIGFCSTAFDFESIELLSENFDMPFWKIPSGEITNLPYLRKIGSLKKSIILSTGMATIDEIKDALEVLYGAGVKRNNIVLLHCTTEYPASIESVNLRAMTTIADHFNVTVGYSDHTEGIDVPIAAVAMGAAVVEKHFTLDKKMEGPDHKASLEPTELVEMVKSIRNVSKALGNGKKEPFPSELKTRDVARKSIVAKCDIAEGECFTEANITVKRPGTGISPMLWDSVIGQVASRAYVVDELVEL